MRVYRWVEVRTARSSRRIHGPVWRSPATGAGVMLAEGLLPDRALALFTDGAAVALGEPLPLAPTSPADVIIVDRDPVTIDPDDLRETVVYETWVRGARVDIG